MAVIEAELPQADSSYLFVGFEADSNLFQAGHGITWGLVNVSSTDTFGIDVQPISEAPFTSQLVFSGFDPYTEADHFYPYSYRSASIDLAESQSGQGFGNIRGFFQVLENGYNQVGFEIDFQGLALPIAFDDVIEKYELPLQPEQEWESTSSYSLGLPDIELYVTQTGGSMVDGSGQIVLPDGSQREVYRIKSSHAVRDSLIVYESADTIVEEYERLQYSWIGTGGFPWVQITLENGVVVESWWQKGLFDGEVMGCTDSLACNYNINATEDDGSCTVLDECGVCGGEGIPEGDCDCNGNQFDAVGTCGGGCSSDVNNNGVCDDQEVPGCTYAFAENYNPDATDDDGSCTVAECDPLEEDGCNLEGDLNGDGFVGTSDLLDFLTQFGAECTPETAFTCVSPVSYQGYDYETVQIGDQCWFAENLRATQYSNGSNIPVALDCALGGTEWGFLFTPAQTVFGSSGGALMGTCIPCNHFNPDFNACNPDLSLSEYGVLYNWYAVNAPGELCPSGWQVPNKAQWEELRDYVLGQGYAEVNTPLRSTGGWIENDNGTDIFGFSGRSGGKRHPNGSFQAAGKIGLWWSRTASGLEAYRFRLDSDNSGQTINTEDWRNGFSVRCIKD